MDGWTSEAQLSSNTGGGGTFLLAGFLAPARFADVLSHSYYTVSVTVTCTTSHMILSDSTYIHTYIHKHIMFLVKNDRHFSHLIVSDQICEKETEK